MRKYYIAMAILSVISLGSAGVQVITSQGATQDQKTADDITALQTTVQAYAETNSRLPESLDQVKLDDHSKKSVQNYHYEKVSYNQFKLCGTFKTDTDKNRPSYVDTRSYPDYHGNGYQCFESTAYGVQAPPPPPVIYKPLQSSNTLSVGYPVCDDKYANITSTLPNAKIQSIDTGGRTITVAGSSGDVMYHWQDPLNVYDAGCKKIDPSNLKAGQTVQLYIQNTQVFVIKQT